MIHTVVKTKLHLFITAITLSAFKQFSPERERIIKGLIFVEDMAKSMMSVFDLQ